MPWQPTEFVRYERSVETSTAPASIITDAGRAFLKAPNNPQGPHALVREFVGTRLASWIGLETFAYAIMRIKSETDEIPMPSGAKAASGTAFLTRAAAGGHVWDGTAEGLDLAENQDAISLFVAFDTWTCNPDRHPPRGTQRKPNPENVFLSADDAPPGRFRLIAYDHTECFNHCGREINRRVAGIDHVKDERIYGLFPVFKERVEMNVVRSAARRLGSIEGDMVRGLIREVPSDWQLTPEAGTALAEFLVQRARYLSDTLIERVSQECGVLPLTEGD